MSIGKTDEKYGRHFFVIAIILIWLILGWLFVTRGYNQTWKLWGVNPMAEPFADFRLIPGSADTFRMGIDPVVINPGDPYQRIFNYPKIWYLLFYTGISQKDTVWISTTMLALFFGCVMFLPGKMGMRDAALTLLVVFSPASMLLYERGNVDLFIFFLCALIIWSLDDIPWLALIILIFGAWVKMFPFFGLSVFFKKNRGIWFRFFFIASVLLGVYMALTFGSVKAAWSQTMRGPDLSYGTNVFFTFLEPELKILFATILPKNIAIFVYEFGPLIFALILLWRVFQRAKNENLLLVESERNLNLFRMGSSIYIGTFLLGNSWDYRLAFLILVMPQISQWMQVSNNRQRGVVRIALVAILFSTWYMFFRASINDFAKLFLFIFDEFANWILLTSLFYLLIASAPQWVRDFKPKHFLNIRNLLKEDA